VRHACGARHAGGTARFYNGGMIVIDPKGPSLPYASRLPKLEYFLLSVKHPDVGHGDDGQILKWLVENRLSSTHRQTMRQARPRPRPLFAGTLAARATGYTSFTAPRREKGV
jgi:hypothetical protein